MADTRRGAFATKRHRRSSPGVTPRRTPVASMAPLAARPTQDHEDESEQDDAQYVDADVGPAPKRIMANPITDMANPEMVRNTPSKRGRATKATRSKRKSSQQQETQFSSGLEPIAGATGQGFNFSPVQQSGTPILLTAARMAPIPGLGYLFQDQYGIQMLVPYSMLPTQPRQQHFWPANYQASASQPMATSVSGLHSYSMPGGMGVGNLQYLNSDLAQYPQLQAQPVLQSTCFQPQTQASAQGCFDESFTPASFESQTMTPSPQNQN
ncbi:hypothetical protein NCS57_00500700 [Fusarium keratoplasticum]|uniref:Uncharacterized protein n=1 Tax=Fusarium keratoplasticum TaxID=1328300 RepID=A0ACC0R6Z1_9HYPO|nr:hypothetical protein NCS57_00500700 [Fusarium keratoplasticum]KAI8675978.1 hypothetical protein NCS57_00500700 [Fusarium keratoplasticum]